MQHTPHTAAHYPPRVASDTVLKLYVVLPVDAQLHTTPPASFCFFVGVFLMALDARPNQSASSRTPVHLQMTGTPTPTPTPLFARLLDVRRLYMCQTRGIKVLIFRVLFMLPERPLLLMRSASPLARSSIADPVRSCGVYWHGLVVYSVLLSIIIEGKKVIPSICRLIWYGAVWYGMVWSGMVWYGMVWYGMVWYGMIWYGMVW